ncbi:MarR family winged helix-turn-helix transcriptional regulator [Tsukamurella soli]|uniref:HTH marR-type domain-containing protein n=1 Tax=Tsukamurella soli TaxID=644556 RepID=A0ABP8J0A1_9ACTN
MTTAPTDLLDTYLRATREFAALAERSAEAAGLTLAQMRLLLTLHDAGTASCSALAARLGVSVSSVTRLIGRAGMAPLVHRKTCATNASAIDLSLTAAGADIVARVTARRADVLREALSGLTPLQAEATAEGLAALAAALADTTGARTTEAGA